MWTWILGKLRRGKQGYKEGDWVEVDTRRNVMSGPSLIPFQETHRGRIRWSFLSQEPYPVPGRLCWVIKVPREFGGFSEIWVTDIGVRRHLSTPQDEIDWILAELEQ